MTRLVFLLACWLSTASAFAGPERIMGLSVLNDTDLSRQGEVVSFGVPFAEGRLHAADLPRLVVLGPDNKVVPSQTRILARWTPFSSLKWVLLTFPASVPAQSKTDYSVWLDDQPHSYSGRDADDDLAMVRALFRNRVLEAVVTDHFDNEFRASEPRLTLEESGPIKTLIRVDGYHRHPAFPRDFLWSTAYITLYHDGENPRPYYRLEWFLKNSYTLRPLGHVRFKNVFLKLRHNSSQPRAIFGDPIGSPQPVPAAKGYFGELYQPDLWGWGGDGANNAAFAIRRAWQTYPKAVSVHPDHVRAWLLPDGDHVLGDGAHMGVILQAAIDIPAVAAGAWSQAFNLPLTTKIEQGYLKSTRAWGDFGIVTTVREGMPLPSLEWKLKRYGWTEYGEYHHSTHTTGSPRNLYSYLLPYMQTGRREHFEWVEDQIRISMSQRPYHWNTFEKKFNRNDFLDDRLWDGYWEWRRPGAGYTARQNIPSEYSPWRSDQGGAWNGWDFEHMTIDDLRDYYLVTGHPKALESIEEILQGYRSYEMCWAPDTHVHSGRVLGWCLRALLDGYQLTGNEQYWQAAEHLVETALLRDGWRYKIVDGWPNGWEPFFFDKKIQNGQSNYDHFKPWMSAIAGVGLTRFLDVSYRRRRAGFPLKISLQRIFRYLVDTAEMIIDYGFIPNEGFIYETDIYDESRDGYYGHSDGTAEWNVEFLMLMSSLTGNPKYFLPAKWVLDIHVAKEQLRGNPWYQVAIRVAGYD